MQSHVSVPELTVSRLYFYNGYFWFGFLGLVRVGGKSIVPGAPEAVRLLAWVDPRFRKVGCVEWGLDKLQSLSGKMTAENRGASYLGQIVSLPCHIMLVQRLCRDRDLILHPPIDRLLHVLHRSS